MNAMQQKALRALLERGLSLVEQPWQQLAGQIGCSEQQVLEQAQRWQDEGLFRRFGLVLKHRALGIDANVMLVMDIDDAEVDALGQRLGRAAGVNLCYRRPRRPPHWNFNLFCMIHGRNRAAVEARVAELLEEHGLSRRPHQLLFSTRAFKQRGARYSLSEPQHG